MASAWSENLIDHVRSAIERGRLIGKTRRAIERAFQTNDLLDPIQIAKRRAKLSDRIEGAEAKRLISLLDVKSTPILPLNFGSPATQGSWPEVMSRLPITAVGA
jgi:hypothetical protein